MKVLLTGVRSHKTTAFLAAIVLAVSVLAASVPFILSHNANALAPVVVTDKTTLKAALADPSVDYIELGNDITTDESLVLSRSNVVISGQDKSITYTGDTAGWQGHYVFQIYNSSNIEINSLRVSGGDAGILINSSQVLLKGNTHVDNFEFGGIEVSKSSNPGMANSNLILQGALWNQTNTEANGKPSVWVVNGQGTLDSSALFQTLIPATHIKSDQTQYYLRDANTGAVATNATQHKTYASLNAAVIAANANDTIELNQNIALAQMVFIDKPLTLDGQGKTITATYSYTMNSVDNSVLTITSDNVTVKNLTTDNISTAAKPHGIVVQQVSNVTLQDLTLKNGRAGVIVNGSTVTATGIHTINNAWYGIDVDKANAKLTISGDNTHADVNGAPAIMVDNRATPSNPAVVDVSHKYFIVANGVSDLYFKDVTGPTIYWQLQPEAVVKDSIHARPITFEQPTTKSVYIDSVSDATLCWTLNSDHFNFDTSNDSCPVLFAALSDGPHKFIAVFTDVAGNSTTSESNTFVVDRTGPAAPVINNSPVYVNISEPNDLATWTHDGVDVDHFEYREYASLDAANADTPYWVTTPGATERQQSVGNSWTTDVTLYYRVIAVDALGNRGALSTIGTLVVDKNAPAVALNASSDETDAPLVSGTADMDATLAFITIDNNDPVQVAVTNGNWSYTTDSLTIGDHTISVIAQDAAGNRSANPALGSINVALATTEPGETTPPVTGGAQTGTDTPTTTDTAQTTNTSAAVATILPAIISPAAAFAGVLGDTTQAPAANNATDDGAAVEGASTKNTAATNLNSEANKGTFLGLGWYWWLLILAAVAAIIWWISAAVRRNQTQN